MYMTKEVLQILVDLYNQDKKQFYGWVGLSIIFLSTILLVPFLMVLGQPIE